MTDKTKRDVGICISIKNSAGMGVGNQSGEKGRAKPKHTRDIRMTTCSIVQTPHRAREGLREAAGQPAAKLPSPYLIGVGHWMSRGGITCGNLPNGVHQDTRN